jgi:hypothetical protein
MAFNPNQSSAPAQRPVGQNESWRKDAFLNFSLPDGKGGFPKLGSIGLKMSKVRERKLIEWLMGTQEKPHDEAEVAARCAQLVSKLVVEIRNAEPDEDAGFDLG